jgi:hypothetical protein
VSPPPLPGDSVSLPRVVAPCPPLVASPPFQLPFPPRWPVPGPEPRRCRCPGRRRSARRRRSVAVVATVIAWARSGAPVLPPPLLGFPLMPWPAPLLPLESSTRWHGDLHGRRVCRRHFHFRCRCRRGCRRARSGAAGVAVAIAGIPSVAPTGPPAAGTQPAAAAGSAVDGPRPHPPVSPPPSP